MRHILKPIALGLLAGAAAFAAPAFAGDRGYYYPNDQYARGGHRHHHEGITIAHTVQPYAYRHTRTVAVPTTVYQPVTRAYTVPVRSYANVETIENVPVTAYQTVRTLERVPVVTYQTVERYHQEAVQAYQPVRTVHSVPVTTYATVNRTEYQPTTVYQVHQHSWCCSLAE